MAAVAIPGLPHRHHQPKSSPPTEQQQQLLLPPHMALHTSARTYKASDLPSFHKPSQGSSSFFPTPPRDRVQDSPMAGGRPPPELFLADACSPETEGEAPRRRQRMQPASEQYAELAALLPGIPPRVNQVEILDAAVAHLKVLADTASVLEAYRALQLDARRRPDVEVASREAVCFDVRLPLGAARPGALTRVLEVFGRRGVEVLVATMTRHGDGAAQVTVTAAPAAPEVTESIKAEIAGIE